MCVCVGVGVGVIFRFGVLRVGKNFSRMSSSPVLPRSSVSLDLTNLGPARSLGPLNHLRGPWSFEEDRILLAAISELGTSDWTAISKHLPWRLTKQCRERYENYLSPDVNRAEWTMDEDIIILDLHSHLGNQWSSISKRLKGRTANAIKNRWHSVLHKLELQCKNPTKEKEYISEMSRLGFLRPTTQSLRTNWVNFAHQNESESSRNSSCPPREPKEIKNALLPASCSEENYKCSCEDISPPYVSMEPNVLQSLPPCAMILMDDDLVFDHLARRLRNPGPIGKRVRDAKSGQDDWFVSAVSPPQKRVHESSQTEAFSSPDTCDEESMNPSEFPLDSTLQDYLSKLNHCEDTDTLTTELCRVQTSNGRNPSIFEYWTSSTSITPDSSIQTGSSRIVVSVDSSHDCVEKAKHRSLWDTSPKHYFRPDEMEPRCTLILNDDSPSDRFLCPNSSRWSRECF